MLEALEDLHLNGVIHHDLKPENFLLRENDYYLTDSSELVLIDFGLSERFRECKGDHVIKRRVSLFTGNVL